MKTGDHYLKFIIINTDRVTSEIKHRLITVTYQYLRLYRTAYSHPPECKKTYAEDWLYFFFYVLPCDRGGVFLQTGVVHY